VAATGAAGGDRSGSSAGGVAGGGGTLSLGCGWALAAAGGASSNAAARRRGRAFIRYAFAAFPANRKGWRPEMRFAL
jgi:hypothetical protein